MTTTAHTPRYRILVEGTLFMLNMPLIGVERCSED
jgi:hypothetical protein